jgi:hypothetical protein
LSDDLRMTADDILKKAKERLAELDREHAKLDAEATKLRAMIAAAEGKTVAPFPAPNPVPFIPVLPQPIPYLPQRGPWDLGEVYCGTVPADTIRGFVAGGICIDTTGLTFRA